MNIKSFILSTAILLTCVTAGYAQECELDIGIAPFITEGDQVPEGVERKLQAKLKTALAHSGVSAADYDCQFFITGRFDEAFSQEAGGVGGRVLVKSELQLAICDGNNKKVYATATFPLKGVGATDEQALTRAMTSLNTNNEEFINFVSKAKTKIIDYFDNNASAYINKAHAAMTQRNYDEALYWSTSIPSCCRHYAEAQALSNAIFSERVNYESSNLLSKAEGAWAADPTKKGAAEAYRYISQIDPSSSSYPAAKALGEKIASTVKADHDFETKEKYRNQVSLEKQRINAARDVAVAWAKSRPKTIVKHHWIVW